MGAGRGDPQPAVVALLSGGRGDRQALKTLFTIRCALSFQLTDCKGPQHTAEPHMESLRQHMQDHMAESTSIEPSEKVVRFRRDIPNSVEIDGTAALELVYQAAELIRGVESRATNMEARARMLVQRAIEKLELAECRVHSAEAEQQAAMAGIHEANIRVHEAEKALKQAESRIAAAESQLSTAELCANTAEMRASDAEKALIRIEDTIRIHLLGQRRDASSNLAAAA
jgi:hypothetical protein